MRDHSSKYAHSVFYGISNALFYYVLYCARTIVIEAFTHQTLLMKNVLKWAHVKISKIRDESELQ